MKRDKIAHKLAAVLTAGVLIGQSTVAAEAATNFTNVTSNIIDGSSTLPNLISTVAYIGGIGLGVAGVFKLKQHVDNPGQTPMKDGLIRLGAGGALLALPFLTSAMMGTVNNGAAGGASLPTFSAVTF